VSLSLFPTLVFSLVVTGILHERFALPGYLIAGLIVYAIVSTLLPGVILHVPPMTYDAPRLEQLAATAEFPAMPRQGLAVRGVSPASARPPATRGPAAPAPFPAPGSDF
jgi:hypothetical protein